MRSAGIRFLIITTLTLLIKGCDGGSLAKLGEDLASNILKSVDYYKEHNQMCDFGFGLKGYCDKNPYTYYDDGTSECNTTDPIINMSSVNYLGLQVGGLNCISFDITACAEGDVALNYLVGNASVIGSYIQSDSSLCVQGLSEGNTTLSLQATNSLDNTAVKTIDVWVVNMDDNTTDDNTTDDNTTDICTSSDNPVINTTVNYFAIYTGEANKNCYTFDVESCEGGDNNVTLSSSVGLPILYTYNNPDINNSICMLGIEQGITTMTVNATNKYGNSASKTYDVIVINSGDDTNTTCQSGDYPIINTTASSFDINVSDETVTCVLFDAQSCAVGDDNVSFSVTEADSTVLNSYVDSTDDKYICMEGLKEGSTTMNVSATNEFNNTTTRQYTVNVTDPYDYSLSVADPNACETNLTQLKMFVSYGSSGQAVAVPDKTLEVAYQKVDLGIDFYYPLISDSSTTKTWCGPYYDIEVHPDEDIYIRISATTKYFNGSVFYVKIPNGACYRGEFENKGGTECASSIKRLIPVKNTLLDP